MGLIVTSSISLKLGVAAKKYQKNRDEEAQYILINW